MSAMTNNQANELLARMSLERKVGQTLAIGFDGTELTPELREMVERYHVGGVILFARNVESPAQVARLTNDLQQVARAAGSPGLLVAIDQEGGRVARMTEPAGFTEFPSAMAVAAAGSLDDARRIGRALAAELRAVGVNADFAPVLDVNNNSANPVIGIRSYGSDPARVTAYGLATLGGLQSGGVLAFGKHFPGHGDTNVDSHFGLPTVAHSRARLDAVELAPFRAAIAAGVAGVMSTHCTFPAIEPAPGLPATLSRAALTGLLRDELGFGGLIATDSLEMGALGAAGFPAPEAAAAALAAGADLLLFNHGHDDHRRAFDLISKRVRRGEIPIARLDSAVLRVLAAKRRFGLLEPALAKPESAAALTADPARRSLSREVAMRSITLLRDGAGLLPLSGGARPCVLETFATGSLGAVLDAEIVPASAEAPAILAQLAGRPLIVGIGQLAQHPEHVALVKRVIAAGAPVVLVALREPYDLLAFPEAPAMLVTYGSPPPALEALAAVLKGHVRPQGRLPVELPGLFALGAGL